MSLYANKIDKDLIYLFFMDRQCSNDFCSSKPTTMAMFSHCYVGCRNHLQHYSAHFKKYLPLIAFNVTFLTLVGRRIAYFLSQVVDKIPSSLWFCCSCVVLFLSVHMNDLKYLMKSILKMAVICVRKVCLIVLFQFCRLIYVESWGPEIILH